MDVINCRLAASYYQLISMFGDVWGELDSNV